MFAIDRHAIVDVEVDEYALQLLWRVVDQNLFVGLPLFGDRLQVVSPDAKKEKFSAMNYSPFVSVVDAERTAHHATNRITRQLHQIVFRRN